MLSLSTFNKQYYRGSKSDGGKSVVGQFVTDGVAAVQAISAIVHGSSCSRTRT
jgi:hypothetical protein